MGSTPSSNVAGHFTFVWEAKCIVINGAPILVLNNVTNHTTNTDTIQILTIYSFSFCFHFSFIFWSASLTRVSYGSQWFVIFVFHFFFFRFIWTSLVLACLPYHTFVFLVFQFRFRLFGRQFSVWTRATRVCKWKKVYEKNTNIPNSVIA